MSKLTPQMSDIGLGKSIFTKQKFEAFSTIQNSQGTRKAFAETAELVTAVEM
jgi:hypothetical protein